MNLFRSVCRLILRGVGPFALLLFCVAQNQPAHATGSTLGLESYLAGATSILPNRRKAWNFNLGIGVGTAPEYIGGKDYEPVVLPLIDIDWRGRVFASTQRGLGFSFFRSNSGFRMGTRLTYGPGPRQWR